MDRDGVLNADGYVGSWPRFRWLPRAPEALCRLARMGYQLVVVSNQSGVARGHYNERDVARLHRRLQKSLASQGVALDGIYYCPHHPDAPRARYRIHCSCRKPGGGLLLRAAAELGLVLGRSVMLGDRSTDLLAGRAAGVARCVQIGTTEPPSALADAHFMTLWDFACSMAGPPRNTVRNTVHRPTRQPQEFQ